METVISRIQKVLEKEFSPREIRLESAGRGKLSGWTERWPHPTKTPIDMNFK